MLRLKLAIAFFLLALFSALVTFSQAPLAEMETTRLLFVFCVSCFVTGVTASLYDPASSAPTWPLQGLSLREKYGAALGRSTT